MTKSLLTPILLLSALLATAQTPVNSVKNISATVETLSNALKSGAQLPDIFVPNMDDVKAMLRNSGKSVDEQQLPSAYQKNKEKMRARFDELKKGIGKIEAVLSWDTVSFRSGGTESMSITIVFTAIRRFDSTPRNVRTLLEFVVLGDRLLASRSLSTTSDLHYDLHVMDGVQSERRDSFYKRFRPYAFTSSEQNVIPFRKKGKWGLITLEGEVKVPAQFDSICRFEFDYYRVVSRQGHNLLDNDFRPVFASPRKRIQKGKNGYLVINKKGVYDDFPKIEMMEEVAIEIPVMEEESRAPQAKKKSFREQLSDEYYKTGPYRIATDRKGDRNNTYTIRHPMKDSIIAVFKGYDYLDAHNIYLAGRDSANNTVVAEYTGKILLRTSHVGRYEVPGYEELYNKKTRLFGVYCPFTNVLIEPKYRYIEPVDRDRFFIVVTQDGKLGYLDGRGKELF